MSIALLCAREIVNFWSTITTFILRLSGSVARQDRPRRFKSFSRLQDFTTAGKKVILVIISTNNLRVTPLTHRSPIEYHGRVHHIGLSETSQSENRRLREVS